mmetsp:Transcript_36345/g.116465  ORF Transcript_36345/g.116465 Transcript_36345/m.116465 type:complete len:99 (-) Transcript_36345:360-656(-)
MRETPQPLLRRPRFLRRKPAPKPDPAVVIEVSPRITNAATVTGILWDTTTLEALGENAITTIVVVPALDTQRLPTGLRDLLEIVPAATPTATPPAASP